MTEGDLQPELRRQADELLAEIPATERAAVLIKNWMSHDARWFMAVAGELDPVATNRVNRIAAHEVGKVEARRVAPLLDLQVATRDDYLRTQEAPIAFLGPELLDYGLYADGSDGFRIEVRRCFAYPNAPRAGVLEGFGCGILARVTGWMAGLGLEGTVAPPLTTCLAAQGEECRHRIAVRRP